MALPQELENLDWSIMPVQAILAVHRVMQQGAKKHGRDTWRRSTKDRRIAFQLAHANAHIKNDWAGWDYDDSDDELNLSHAATRLLMVVDLILNGLAIDDRKRGKDEANGVDAS